LGDKPLEENILVMTKAATSMKLPEDEKLD
jgi:hypothetical protein